MLRKILLLAAAGSMGTLSRAGLVWATTQVAGRNFPWGTLSVNVLDRFSPVSPSHFSRKSLSERGFTLHHHGRIHGAFTTFSAYMIDTAELAREGHLLKSIGNVLTQNILGIISLLLGVYIGRLSGS